MSQDTKEPAPRSAVAGNPFIFGVSGHRDLVPTDLPELRQQLQRIFGHYRRAYPEAAFRLLSPLAEGADRVAAEVAVHSGIELHVPIPMMLSDYERDFTAAGSLEEFRRLLRSAHSQWEITGGSLDLNVPAEGAVRAQKYATVGDYIAKNSHVLILLWDGCDTQKIGGTSWVKSRREYWLRTATREGIAPNDFGYVATVHVVTPRLAPEDSSQPQPRIEIIGGLPPVQTDVRSKL